MAELAEHPTAAPPRIGKQGDPCVMVIFGAAGDLTRRKLIPGLYNLSCVGCMNPQFEVLGVGRTPMRSEDFRAKMREAVADSLHHQRIDWRKGGAQHQNPEDRAKTVVCRDQHRAPEQQRPASYAVGECPHDRQPEKI